MPDPNIMGSLADQSTYDPATGMPYPGNAPDYGDLSQRMTNFEQRLPGHIASGIRDWIAVPGQAYGTVPGGPPTPEQEMDWGRGTALGMLGAARLPGGAPAGAVGAGGGRLIQPYVHTGEIANPGESFRAYHSSPYTFTKFDPSMIGTGEGAQMYGHGFYFAENPAVSGQGGQYWNQFLNRFSPEEQGAAKALQGTNFNRGEVLATLQNSINEISDHLKYFKSSDPLMYEADVGYHNKLLRIRQQQYDMVASGNPVGPRTYEVDINARPEQMLNWDAPWQAQPRQIQDIAQASGIHPDSAGPMGTRIMSDAPMGELISRRIRDPNSLLHRNLTEAGIPGIRYLDQGSRPRMVPLSEEAAAATRQQIANIRAEIEANKTNPNALPAFFSKREANIRQLQKDIGENQTSNYVIFDPNKLDIRRMYAVPGAVGAGGIMGGIAAQDNYQPQ